MKIIMIGGSGAVGSEVIRNLVEMDEISKITLLGRREHKTPLSNKITVHVVDLENSNSFEALVNEHDVAICTLGIGEPTKAPKDVFISIDKNIPILFAETCRRKGISSFHLLSSVVVNAKSKSFFLRTKGELEGELKKIGFKALNLFHPSMILTPKNRYGFSQAITLSVWPLLTPLLIGPLRKFRGVKIETLGAAIANNVNRAQLGNRVLEWDDFHALAK